MPSQFYLKTFTSAVICIISLDAALLWQTDSLAVRVVREDHGHLLHGGCQSALTMLQSNQCCFMCTSCSSMKITLVLSSFNLILNIHMKSTAIYHLHFQAIIIILVCILSPGNKCTFRMKLLYCSCLLHDFKVLHKCSLRMSLKRF